MSSADDIRALADEYPQTFAQQAGITLADTPSPLFRLLVLTALLSANLDPKLGLRTAKALGDAGFTTAQHLADATEKQRWQVLSDSKYLRKEQTARQLGELASRALDEYGGDLRALRDEANGDVDVLRESLQGFTGIGAVGADIYLREVQAVWSDLRPFADERVLKLAADRGLPHTVAGLSQAAGTEDLSGVGAALVQAYMAERSG